MKPLILVELDHEFLKNVENLLSGFFKASDASKIIKDSSLLVQITENPEFVYHYDEAYWANIVRLEFEAKMKRTSLQ